MFSTENEYATVGLAFFTPSADLDEENANWLTKICIKMNQFAAWWSADSRCAEKRFSHVELLLDDGFSYSIKMGSCVSQTWRNYRDRELYGFVNVRINKKYLHEIHKQCSNKVNQKVAFSYWGLFANFIIPTCLMKLFYREGIYRSEKHTFCSKFVSEMLLNAGILNATTSDPDVMSPNNLWADLMEWSEQGENFILVVNTNIPAHSELRHKAESMREINLDLL